jgi:drug/metabolite transporter (DMT)-like permease
VRDRIQRYGVELALVAVAAVWGGTFVMVKDAVRVGVLAGLFLTAGYVFQTWGLQDTNPSKAAFITGMFVVITPALQFVVLRRAPRLTALGGVAAAVVGLWLLSGASAGGWTAGDTRVLLCAVAYSAQMIVLGGKGREHDVRALTLVQLVVTAVITGAVSLAVERPALPAEASVWAALLVTGVLASAVAFAVQTYAQRHISPTRTALILIMEPVFGGIFGYFLAGDRLGTRGWLGAGLIFLGMLFSEVLAAIRFDGERDAVLEPNLEGPPAPVLEPSRAEDMAE